MKIKEQRSPIFDQPQLRLSEVWGYIHAVTLRLITRLLYKLNRIARIQYFAAGFVSQRLGNQKAHQCLAHRNPPAL